MPYTTYASREAIKIVDRAYYQVEPEAIRLMLNISYYLEVGPELYVKREQKSEADLTLCLKAIWEMERGKS